MEVAIGRDLDWWLPAATGGPADELGASRRKAAKAAENPTQKIDAGRVVRYATCFLTTSGRHIKPRLPTVPLHLTLLYTTFTHSN